MEHEEAFLREIRENPDEIASRLIYADWLEEQGDPRGEFIRVQVELSESRDEAQTIALTAREDQLLRTYQKHWVQPLKKIGVESPVFRCGFVERVKLTAAQFIKHADKLPVLLPVVRILKLEEVEPADVREIGELPTLQTVIALELAYNELGDAGMDGLVESPHLNHLQSLGLRQTGVGPGGVGAIVTAPWFSGLTTLVLSENRIGNAGTQALANAPSTTGLRELSLHRNDIGDAGGMSLVNSPYLEEINWLNLHNNTFDDTVQNALRTKFGSRVWF